MGVADKTYYLDAKGSVTDSAEKGAIVLINKGQEIPADMAQKYGLGRQTDTAKAKAETVVDDAAGDAKASKPAANKAAKPGKDK